jgi:hypothetical protein
MAGGKGSDSDEDSGKDGDNGSNKDGDSNGGSDGNTDGDTDRDTDENPDKYPDKKKQSRGADKRFAQVRREAERERDAAIEKAKEEAKAEAKAEIDKMVAAMNLKNPYTGELIRTKAEYDEAVAKKNAEQAEQALKKAGLSTELLQDIIKELPVVKEAREAAASFRTAAERAELEKARLAAEAELREISKLDPAIQSIEDFKKRTARATGT